MSFVEMSVDPGFASCIDLLGVWDVKQTIPGKLKTFIGEEGEQEILQRFQMEG